MQNANTQDMIAKDAIREAENGSGAAPDPFLVARSLNTPVWVFDIDEKRINRANAQACVMWDSEDEASLCARDLSEGMSTTVAKRLKQYQSDFIASGATFREMWTLYPKGMPVSVSVAYSGYRLPDGRMAMLCEVLGNSSDTPENLRSAEAVLHTDVMVALFSLDGAPLYLNPAAHNLVVDPKLPLSAFFLDANDYHVMMFELEGKGEHRIVAKAVTSEGEKWVDISAKMNTDAVTGAPALLLTAIDVSELKTARDQASYLAERDQMTGCFNRGFLTRHITTIMRKQARNCVLLYFDVDRFKQINDTFGHDAGDNVLKELAFRAQNSVRADDVVVRLGGDEFVIMLVEEDRRNLKAIAERMFTLLSGLVYCGSTSIPISVSMGATTFEPGLSSLEEALKEADTALYEAKRQGRNKVVLYTSEMGEAARSRRRTEEEIKVGLTSRQFFLHYQPRVDVRLRKVVSVEGLARWNHPQKGLVFPGSFIPICEETGQIDILGQQVLEIGFDQARSWAKAGLDLGVSVNISPRQFANPNLMESLEAFAQDPNFPTGKFELEITENVLIGDLDDIAMKLRTITELGYHIAIDDFGTGYSNLSYISRIPLNCIKIDQSFVRQLPESGPIIRLILSLAKQIEALVVAEGVETQDQYDWLEENECDQIQGYLISKPVALGDLEERYLPGLEIS